jgi:membrane protein
LKTNYFSLTKKIITRIQRDNITAWAAQLTFYIILSVFPFAILIMEILDRINFITIDAIYELTRFFPEEIVKIIQLLIEDIAQNESPGSTLVISSIATLYSASKGIQAIINSLNIAYNEKETRSFFYLKAVSLIYTLLLAIILIILLALIIYGNKILTILMSYAILSELPNTLFDILRYLFAIIAVFLFFILVYNVSPNRKISFKDELPGSLFATLFFILLSYVFSIYINHSPNLSYVYGSLTSIIILMLWLFFSSIIIMIGGEINGVYSTEIGKNDE